MPPPQVLRVTCFFHPSTENWCYYPKVLRDISKHHESGDSMPDELINKIIDSQFINQGLFNLRQLYFGKFDLTVHGQKPDSEGTHDLN